MPSLACIIVTLPLFGLENINGGKTKHEKTTNLTFASANGRGAKDPKGYPKFQQK